MHSESVDNGLRRVQENLRTTPMRLAETLRAFKEQPRKFQITTRFGSFSKVTLPGFSSIARFRRLTYLAGR
jgi:hypothetical protein